MNKGYGKMTSEVSKEHQHMEKVHSDALDWRNSEPLSLEEKTEKFADVRMAASMIPRFALTPKQRKSNRVTLENLAEEASFAFNTLTAYDESLDPRAVDSSDITNHLDAARTFRALAERSGKDARVFGETLPEYAEMLENIATNKAHENFEAFEGTSGVLTDEYRPPNYEERKPASALLLQEQWSDLIQKQWRRNAHSALLGQETYGSSLQLMPKELTVNIRQITLLCDAQTDLRTTLAEHSNPANKEIQRENIHNIISLLDSPELDEEKIASLPAAAALKKLALAQAVRTLGELSEDDNPESFTKNREDSIKFAINELREAEIAIDKVIAQAPPEIQNIHSIKDKIRFLHDQYSASANLPQIGWTQAPLADLPEFAMPTTDFIKQIPVTPQTHSRKKVGVLAMLATPRRDNS